MLKTVRKICKKKLMKIKKESKIDKHTELHYDTRDGNCGAVMIIYRLLVTPRTRFRDRCGAAAIEEWWCGGRAVTMTTTDEEGGDKSGDGHFETAAGAVVREGRKYESADDRCTGPERLFFGKYPRRVCITELLTYSRSWRNMSLTRLCLRRSLTAVAVRGFRPRDYTLL